jgi:hypothetical protein|tara:strand:+ start:3699 stop:4058 length:360 start_codon:yes stop_codon:yes gene_type:complete
MQVKVQYVVELEEIPKEVRGLLPDCDAFEDRIKDLTDLIDKQSFTIALDEIEAIRESMYKVDQRLADCGAILTGYLNVKNSPPEAPQPQNNLDFDLEQLKGLASIVQPQEQGEENDSTS